jgi:hypothetical protein
MRHDFSGFIVFIHMFSVFSFFFFFFFFFCICFDQGQLWQRSGWEQLYDLLGLPNQLPPPASRGFVLLPVLESGLGRRLMTMAAASQVLLFSDSFKIKVFFVMRPLFCLFSFWLALHYGANLY